MLHHELCKDRHGGMSEQFITWEMWERGADVKVERNPNDREKPQHSVKPADIPVQPIWVVVDEWLKYQIKGVD